MLFSVKPVKVPLVGGSKPPAKPPRPSISVIDVDGRTTEKVEPSEFSKASVKNGGGGVITRQPASSLHPSSNSNSNNNQQRRDNN